MFNLQRHRLLCVIGGNKVKLLSIFISEVCVRLLTLPAPSEDGSFLFRNIIQKKHPYHCIADQLLCNRIPLTNTFWAKLVRFGQNQKLASPKTLGLLRLCKHRVEPDRIRYYFYAVCYY